MPKKDVESTPVAPVPVAPVLPDPGPDGKYSEDVTLVAHEMVKSQQARVEDLRAQLADAIALFDQMLNLFNRRRAQNVAGVDV